MGKITFILGGARSGKSRYALELAKEKGKGVAFIATCQALDGEMAKRIELHKKTRPSDWQTIEEPKDLAPILKRIDAKFGLVIIDCLTLLISNLVSEKFEDEAIESKIEEMLKTIKSAAFEAIVVSNEVGLGIVPQNSLARRFRDLAGRVNQIVAAEANEVLFMVSGMPLKIKGE
ncbi:MAG: bifunctional adenosylcobinamide kinase/adenosylcobinamide-phosphate guanylyltransferase [Candidatus Omnitrophica bacterium]|nr:bifunctional adenosylcobinamide kinase/adenosylcobinamide-phosphate guanylyltransferase [Candidatus Omnitrophota bacterium]